MADWSSLPSELVCLISHRLLTIEDFSALTAVCRSFRSAAGKSYKRLDTQPPWLLLSCPDNEDNPPPTAARGLLSIYRHNKRFSLTLPELNGRHCWGSPHGWIITLGMDLQLHLFNPLNRHRIPLPLPEIIPVDEFNFEDDNDKGTWMRYIYVRRALLVKKTTVKRTTELCASATIIKRTTVPSASAAPNHSEELFNKYFVVLTTSPYSKLRVLRPHDNTWVLMNQLYKGSEMSTGLIFDVVNYKGVIYALCVRGRMLICSNLDGPDPPTATEIIPVQMELLEGDEKLYLVESDGDLLMVARYIDFDVDESPRYLTTGFVIFKLNLESKPQWVEVEDLGDRALFVGDCQSLSLSPSSMFNCRSNCIYFADDNHEQFGDDGMGGHDMGIFDLENDSVRRFYEGPDMQSSYSPPNWFIPSYV